MRGRNTVQLREQDGGNLWGRHVNALHAHPGITIGSGDDLEWQRSGQLQNLRLIEATPDKSLHGKQRV